MRTRRFRTVAVGALVALVASTVIAATAGAAGAAAAAGGAEVQLTPVTQTVPTPPRWFHGDDGRVHLQYEVLLTNTIPLPVDVTEVQVRGDGRPLETLSGTALAAATSPLGSERGSGTTLPGSSSAVVWVDLTLASPSEVPDRVSQRLTIDVGPGLPVGPSITSTGGRAAVDQRAPIVLDAPLRGGPWVAIGGPDGPHRRALQAVDGELRLSQRFAIDFSALLDDAGRTHAGDPDVNASYFDYGQPVLAVADATVVEAVDDLPDQIANHAVELPTAAQDGNHVILELRDGVYVGYAHLVPGSVRVRAGDRVRTGDVLGRVGNSGSSSGPHLHLQVMDRPSFLAADGLPFVISRFTGDGTIPTLDGFVDEDRTGAPVEIDTTGAGARRDRGLAGLGVVTFPGRARLTAARGDVTGLVDIGGGRELFVECRGSGSPTVVLISGKGTDAADWMQIADPADPALHAPTDDVGAGLVPQVASDDAVFPSVARFTRVCAYDRPDTRLTGADRSTPRDRQPHTVDQDVRDLHRLLRALDEPEPYVLVPHSYGGWIAELYARTYPKRIGGLVMVDAATALLRDVMTPAQLANWDATNRMTSPQLAEGVRVIDAIDQVRAAGPMPKVPAIVLTADKPYRTDLLPAGTDPDAGLTFASWRAAQDQMAAALGAEHVTTTDSGHHVYLYSPGIVVDAIRTVVERVRA